MLIWERLVEINGTLTYRHRCARGIDPGDGRRLITQSQEEHFNDMDSLSFLIGEV